MWRQAVAPEWRVHRGLPAWRADADGALGLHCAHGPKRYLLIWAVDLRSGGADQMGERGSLERRCARRRHGQGAEELVGVRRSQRSGHHR